MARRVTPIPSGCHSPEPRAVRTTTRSPTVVRVSHRTRIRASTKTPPPSGPDPATDLRTACITDANVIRVRRMSVPPLAPADVKAQLARLASEYHATANVSRLREQLADLVQSATPDALISAAEPHRDEPEVIVPVYEAIVSAQPDNARALVILANAYWLQGRGPQVVGELATKAIAADPANRGAWHLWALSESDPRSRVRRHTGRAVSPDRFSRSARTDAATPARLACHPGEGGSGSRCTCPARGSRRNSWQSPRQRL